MAGEWDPLGDAVEATQGAGEGDPFALVGLAAGENGHIPLAEGAKEQLTAKDFGRLLTDLRRKLDRETPWTTKPNPLPDLSWHQPTCTLEAWKHQDVKLELGPQIAYITLNRPSDNNTLSDGLVAGLCDAVVLLHTRPDIRLVVFSGEGKMLSAGRDPKGDPFGFSVKPASEASLAAESTDAANNGAFPDGKVNLGRLLQAKLWHAWATLPQFTICIANGSALGDGMGLVLCSDMAIALNGAFFGFSDTKFGLVSANISPYLFHKTSAGVAKNMFVRGQLLSADAALEKGIVDRVVASLADAHAAVKEICAEVSQNGPRSVQLAKELATGVAGRQIDEEVMFYTVAMACRAAASDEAAQALAAAAGKAPKPWEATTIQPLR